MPDKSSAADTPHDDCKATLPLKPAEVSADLGSGGPGRKQSDSAMAMLDGLAHHSQESRLGFRVSIGFRVAIGR